MSLTRHKVWQLFHEQIFVKTNIDLVNNQQDFPLDNQLTIDPILHNINSKNLPFAIFMDLLKVFVKLDHKIVYYAIIELGV